LLLIKNKGITAFKLTSDLNLPNSAVTDWKNGRSKPGTDAIIKIAKYFGVSADYLLTGNEFDEENESSEHGLLIPADIKGTKVFFHSSTGKTEFTEDEVDKLSNFIEFIKFQRDNNLKK